MESQQQLQKLEAEVASLRSSLLRKGVLLDSDLHRARFEEARRRTSWTPVELTLEQVLEAPPIAGAWPSWGLLSHASRGFRRSLKAVEWAPRESLVVAGGFDRGGVQAVELLSLGPGPAGGGAWAALPPMAAKRRGHAGVSMGPWLFICGGECQGRPSQSVVKLGLVAGAWQWQPVPSLRQPRCEPAAVAVSRRLFVFGGRDDVQGLDSLECLDPEAGGRWELLQPMSVPRTSLAGAALRGSLYALGGKPRHTAARSAESCQPFREARWHSLPTMPLACSHVAAAACCSKLYVCGGMDGRDEAMDSLQVYDPAANAWFLGRPMPRPRCRHSATVCAGRLYVLGGHLAYPRPGVAPENSADCLPLADPGACWAPVEPMRQRRAEFCAAVLQFGTQWP